MIFDQDRVDEWLTKGLGGGVDMLEQRSKVNKFLDRALYDTLMRTIQKLQSVIADNKSTKQEDFEKSAFDAVDGLVSIIFERAENIGIRAFDKDKKSRIEAYLKRLVESFDRFVPKD